MAVKVVGKGSQRGWGLIWSNRGSAVRVFPMTSTVSGLAFSMKSRLPSPPRKARLLQSRLAVIAGRAHHVRRRAALDVKFPHLVIIEA